MTSVEDKIDHPISEDEDEYDEIDDRMKSVENKIAILEKSTEKLKERNEAFERLFKIDKNEVNYESE